MFPVGKELAYDRILGHISSLLWKIMLDISCELSASNVLHRLVFKQATKCKNAAN